MGNYRKGKKTQLNFFKNKKKNNKNYKHKIYFVNREFQTVALLIFVMKFINAKNNIKKMNE